MRTLGFGTNVVLTCAAAAALITALGLPWYGPALPPPAPSAGAMGDVSGPLAALFAAAARWPTATDGMSGWQAFEVIDLILVALAAGSALAALAAPAPALQRAAATFLRPAVLTTAALVAYHMVNQPGADGALELRRGAFLALGAAPVLVAAGMAVAEAPSRRRRPAPCAPASAGRASVGSLWRAAGRASAGCPLKYDWPRGPGSCPPCRCARS